LPPNLSTRKRDVFAREWVAIWKNLAAMEGLKRLRVELIINPGDSHHWTGEEERILESIKIITRPELFELILPFPTNPRIEGPPCAISRRG